MASYEATLKGKYPGKLHAKKVVEYIRSKVPGATGVIYLEGKQSKLHEDCDQEEHFRYGCIYLSTLPSCLSTHVSVSQTRSDNIPEANVASSTT